MTQENIWEDRGSDKEREITGKNARGKGQTMEDRGRMPY